MSKGEIVRIMKYDAMNTIKAFMAIAILATSFSPNVGEAHSIRTVSYGCPAGTTPVWDPEQHRVVCV
jgi:hypothetical protein